MLDPSWRDPSKQCRPAMPIKLNTLLGRDAGGIDRREELMSKQVNKNNSSLVRIDPELKRRLKIKAAAEKTTIKALVEEAVVEVLGVQAHG